jgi:hypothetical protein
MISLVKTVSKFNSYRTLSYHHKKFYPQISPFVINNKQDSLVYLNHLSTQLIEELKTCKSFPSSMHQLTSDVINENIHNTTLSNFKSKLVHESSHFTNFTSYLHENLNEFDHAEKAITFRILSILNDESSKLKPILLKYEIDFYNLNHEQLNLTDMVNYWHGFKCYRQENNLHFNSISLEHIHRNILKEVENHFSSKGQSEEASSPSTSLSSQIVNDLNEKFNYNELIFGLNLIGNNESSNFTNECRSEFFSNFLLQYSDKISNKNLDFVSSLLVYPLLDTLAASKKSFHDILSNNLSILCDHVLKSQAHFPSDFIHLIRDSTEFTKRKETFVYYFLEKIKSANNTPDFIYYTKCLNNLFG